MDDPLKPSVSLLAKLGSIAVHAQEMTSSKGHAFDKHALDGVLADPEVKAWLRSMDKMAMLPKRRG